MLFIRDGVSVFSEPAWQPVDHVGSSAFMDAARFQALETDVMIVRNSTSFDAGLVAYCRAMTELAPRGSQSRKLFHRLGRYLIWLTAISNHQAWLNGGGEPPTLTLLQARTGLSPRQVSDIVGGLVAGALLSVVRDGVDDRRRRLVPSDGMVLVFAEHLRHYLDLYDRTSPERHTGHDGCDPASLGRMIGLALGEAPAIQLIVARFPQVYHFASQDCGYHVLCAVMVSVLRKSALPGDVALSLSGLAARLHVSKAHVGRMLADARDANLFSIDRGRSVDWVSPQLVDEFASHAARNALYYAGILRRFHPVHG